MILVVQPGTTAANAERELLRRCAAGERAAQTRLYRQEVRRVHGLLYRVLGPSSALEDTIQETFIRVFRSLAQFRGDSQLSTWIGGIALNVAFGHLRANPPPAARLELVPDPHASTADVDQQLAARQGLHRVYQILDRMDPKLRIAFTLHAIDGRPLREVADLTSSSLVATKTRVWRARRELEKRAKRDPLLLSYIDEALSGSSGAEASAGPDEASDEVGETE
jgi:RNA polymerase sigma-70 factor, ECF subfamily